MISVFANNSVVQIAVTRKNGSTSIHALVFEALGQSWNVNTSSKKYWLGSEYFVNRLKNLGSDLEVTDRVCVLRDPVDRMRSTYVHSVANHKRTPFEQGSIPSWSEFLENFDSIRARHSKIRIHSEPQVDSIGPASNYDKVFLTPQISTDFVEWFNSTASVNLRPVHKKNLRSNKISVTAEDREIIQQIYSRDYEAYSLYFS